MLLNTLNPFTMEVPNAGIKNTKLTATFRDMTKKERKAFETKNSDIEKNIKIVQKKMKELKRANKRLEIAEKTDNLKDIEKYLTKCEKLEDEIENINNDFDENGLQSELLKERFELCLDGKDTNTIMELAETHGYPKVFNVIQQSIIEAENDRLEKLKNG